MSSTSCVKNQVGNRVILLAANHSPISICCGTAGSVQLIGVDAVDLSDSSKLRITAGAEDRVNLVGSEWSVDPPTWVDGRRVHHVVTDQAILELSKENGWLNPLSRYDNSRVSPTNNLTERAIRSLVVLRKLTFGSRSLEGGERMADLMTVAETARRHLHRASDIYYGLFTRPSDQVLRLLYAFA